jgi:ATP-dependent helicase HrpB
VLDTLDPKRSVVRKAEVPSIPLPVDALLPDLEAALRDHAFAVLEAAPGAGKTTRVPLWLSDLRAQHPGQVIVTEPRRIAARLAAHFVAKELGQAVGERVGYSVRFEERVSAKTQIRYVTEGVFLRQLLADPALKGVHTVVIDEYHERHLTTDQLLTFCKHIARKRADLRVVVMSATLDAEPLAAFLGGCPRLRSPGRSHPLRLEYAEADERPLEKRVASAVRRAFQELPDGNLLVFLPGLSEIHKARDALARSVVDEQHEVVVLHGDQPIDEQARAVSLSSKRRVVLATNVAESSITVDGVRAVIDSGLARVAAHSAWTGASTLRVEKVSQSSAIQRAGRAARQGPGVVYRLFSEADFATRPFQQAPELQRGDLAQLVLECKGFGLAPELLDWVDPLPAATLTAAYGLLTELGALDAHKQLTALGRRMLQLPVAPRLARMILAGAELGVAEDAALAATLLAERDIHDPRVPKLDLPTSSSDIQDRLDRYLDAEHDRFSAHSLRGLALEPGRVREVQRSFERLRRMGPRNNPELDRAERELRLRRAILFAFSDRVARRKSGSRNDLILASGTSARLSEESVVRTDQFLLALDIEERSVEGRRSGPTIRWSSSIEPDWLLTDFAERVTASDEFTYAQERGRVECVSRLMFGSVALEESRMPSKPCREAAEVLYNAVRDQRTTLLGKTSATETLRCRIELLRAHACPVGLITAEELSDEALLHEACESATRFDELCAVDFEQLLLSRLKPAHAQLLRQECPTDIALASGRRLTVHYEPGRPPWIASRLQDFFGMTRGPSVAQGRVPLTIELLAPNQRAVQVTSDLAGFWERHYAEVRKELRRRYPRHAWPEDGRTAAPPPPKERGRP